MSGVGMPTPYESPLFSKLLSRIEPGDLLGGGSAARVTVLSLTAAARPKTSVHHPVTNRVTSNGVGSPPGFQARIVSGHWPQFFA